MKQGDVNISLNSFSFVRANFDFTSPVFKLLKTNYLHQNFFYLFSILLEVTFSSLHSLLILSKVGNK